MDTELTSLELRVSKLTTQVADLSAHPLPGPEGNISTLESKLSSLSSRLDDFEAALGDEPTKRLGTVMLRKDLDSLREQSKADIAAVHEEMTRTFDLMKWLLGLVGAGSLVSGLSSLFTRRESKKEASE